MSVGELSRRSVLNGCALCAVAGVIGFVVAKNSAAAAPKSATAAANAYGTVQSGGELLAKLNQVPTGGGLILASAGVVLTSDAKGTVRGFSATCTHQGCAVETIENGVIVCPCHGSRFDITTGAPVAGPATVGLAEVVVVVRGDSVFTG